MQKTLSKSSPYFRSLKDNDFCKKMFVGREDELNTLSQTIQNDWVAIYGERRMGKSFLSLVFRDLINQTFSSYINHMIDDNTSQTIKACSKRLAGWKAHYIDMLSVHSESALFGQIAQVLQSESNSAAHYSDIFSLSSAIDYYVKESGLKGIIIILDEFEKILDFPNRVSLIDELRSLFQTSSTIRLVIIGSLELKSLSLRETTSPLLNVIRLMPLKPLLLNDTIELIKPLSQFVPIADDVTEPIFALSGGNPFLVQSICQLIYEHSKSISSKTLQKTGFLEMWKPDLETEFFSQTRHILEGYLFKSRPGAELYSQVAIKLSQLGSASAKDIASGLGYDIETIEGCLLDFLAIGKIKKVSEKYRFTAELIEAFAQKFMSFPAPSPAPSEKNVNIFRIEGSQGITIGDQTQVAQEFEGHNPKKSIRKKRGT